MHEIQSADGAMTHPWLTIGYSIMYKMKLPMVLVFNKTDVVSHESCMRWMQDCDEFQAPLTIRSLYAHLGLQDALLFLICFIYIFLYLFFYLWGKLGTTGQSSTKELPDQDKAIKEAEKLVGQKERKVLAPRVV